jgi:putative ABC transport system substrate-binding protein
MRRRKFITVIGGVAATWPVIFARAQQPAMPVIGFLGSRSSESDVRVVAAVLQGLGEVGYVEGRDVAIEYRWADSQYDRLPALAADLVRRPTAVIIAGGIPSALAAKAATTIIPVVFSIGADPVEVGLVASLKRPGGNLTGVTSLGMDLGPKRLELLHELLPTATIAATLVNPTNPTSTASSTALQAAARGLGLHLHILEATAEHDFASAFATSVQLRASALMITQDGLFIRWSN